MCLRLASVFTPVPAVLGGCDPGRDSVQRHMSPALAWGLALLKKSRTTDRAASRKKALPSKPPASVSTAGRSGRCRASRPHGDDSLVDLASQVELSQRLRSQLTQSGLCVLGARLVGGDGDANLPPMRQDCSIIWPPVRSSHCRVTCWPITRAVAYSASVPSRRHSIEPKSPRLEQNTGRSGSAASHRPAVSTPASA